MAQVMVNFRMDEEVKRDMERACKAMGMSMTTAFTIFAAKVGKEQRIPFEVAVNPFYSGANIARLKKAIADMEAGRDVAEHDLIEAEDA